MRIDSSANTNLYTKDVNSNEVNSSQQDQPQTILLQKTENQDKSPSSNYFESLGNLGANFLAFKLKQQTTTPQQNNSSTSSNSINSTQKEEPKQNTSQVVTKPASSEKINSEELNTSSWVDKGGKVFDNQNKYNKLILESVKDPKNPWPEFSPKILKSMIAQESGFDPKSDNGKGFIGLTQMNKTTAQGEGKLSFASGDSRTQPDKIIPATLRVLTAKTKALDVGATVKSNSGQIVKLPGFNYYGNPSNQDKIKFALAAYNGGQGTVLGAIKKAYGNTVPSEGVKFDDVEKYLPKETKNYVKEILDRADKQ